MSRRLHPGLALALAGTLGAAAWMTWAPEPEPVVDLLATPARTVKPAPAAASRTEPAPSPRTPWPRLTTAAAQSWGPPLAPRTAPAPAKPATSPPPAPQAPVLAYTLIGRYDDGSGAMALLASPQRTLAVRPGDLIDAQWRVEAVSAQRVDLLWLPGAMRRSLTYPSGS